MILGRGRPRALPLESRDEERLESLSELLERARPRLPRDPFPHFLAHLRWQSGERLTDVLFVHQAPSDRAADPELVIADWQTSKLAEVLFAGVEGRKYSLSTARGSVTGLVLERHFIGFRDGEIAHVITPDHRLVRGPAGVFVRVEREAPVLAIREAALRERTPSLIDVTLDPTQRRVVELPGDQSVLILGEAGHGKTTVALHRLARLWRSAGQDFRAVVLVPTDGLRGLLASLLGTLGVDVEVELYDRWARSQAHAVFPKLPARESEDASAGVIRFKRDPALREALALLAEPQRKAAPPKRPTRARNGLARRRDLLHLFGDRALIARVTRASSAHFGAHVIAELLEHTHVQFSRTSEEQHAHVDAERLVTLDGRPIDEGTPLGDAGSIDAEDYAVLFELDRLRAELGGRLPSVPPRYDCILIDEAQELAPLELALIGRSVSPDGTLIVAGDADQQTDPTVSFTTWQDVMRELGRESYQRVVLPVSYRCPPQVSKLARSLLSAGSSSSGAAKGRGRARRPSTADAVTFVHFANECHLCAWLIEELERVADSDPSASVAVICRSAHTARRLHGALRHKNLGRLVLDGQFLFRSGINVTDLDQVKGLEFDYVIVPDASPNIYPDTAEARRALYVAVTRARHQLVLGAVAGRSPLLPGAVPEPRPARARLQSASSGTK